MLKTISCNLKLNNFIFHIFDALHSNRIIESKIYDLKIDKNINRYRYILFIYMFLDLFIIYQPCEGAWMRFDCPMAMIKIKILATYPNR